HRLDRTTTGVLIFGKSQESAKKYAEFFFDRKVKKTYQFVTARLSAKNEFEIDSPILQKAKELPAQTSFKKLKDKAGVSLWEAYPHTGRNHQIRIHAQIAGVPLLGDEKYNGATYPFICLHDRRIEFPNGIVIEAEPPAYFEDLEILGNVELAKLVHEADRRERLFRMADDSQCFRLLQARDEKDMSVDRFGKVIATENANANVERLAKMKSCTTSDLTWTAREQELVFELVNESAPGLYLDQRLLRNWVKQNSFQKSVLNLFSYTCGFALAAKAGGASSIASVDKSKTALARGKRNFELNGFSLEAAKFMASDSLDFLELGVKKSFTHDLVICHVPSFHRREKGSFRIEKDLEMLVGMCLKSLSTNGQLLLLTNARQVFAADLRRTIEKVIKESGLQNFKIEFILPSLDLELVEESPNLKAFLVSKT
ncbi:MAG: class I SAM-dependent methyltransferase, partial [Bdellovibrionota bacterium]